MVIDEEILWQRGSKLVVQIKADFDFFFRFKEDKIKTRVRFTLSATKFDS